MTRDSKGSSPDSRFTVHSKKSRFLLRSPSFQNESMAGLVFAARFKSFRQLSPRADRMMPAPTAFRLTLAAAHRMVDWVHGHAAHMRTTPAPAGATGFAARDIHVIDISNLADGGVSVLVNAADFARRQFHERITAFEVVQGRLLTGAASNLPAAARSQLDVVNVCTK